MCFCLGGQSLVLAAQFHRRGRCYILPLELSTKFREIITIPSYLCFLLVESAYYYVELLHSTLHINLQGHYAHLAFKDCKSTCYGWLSTLWTSFEQWKCPRMSLPSKYCEHLLSRYFVASCSCYISQDRGRPHPPSCSPSTRYKTIISASSSQYEQTSYTPHTFHLNPTLE